MNLPLILALSVALAALFHCRKLERSLSLVNDDFLVLQRANIADFKRTMLLAQQHDRLLGEKNQLQALLDARGQKIDRMIVEWARESTALRAELKRRHRKCRGV